MLETGQRSAKFLKVAAGMAFWSLMSFVVLVACYVVSYWFFLRHYAGIGMYGGRPGMAIYSPNISYLSFYDPLMRRQLFFEQIWRLPQNASMRQFRDSLERSELFDSLGINRDFLKTTK